MIKNLSKKISETFIGDFLIFFCKIIKESRLMSASELTEEQTALQKMSEEVFRIKLKNIDGVPEIHGKYDSDNDIMYINGKAETSLD